MEASENQPLATWLPLLMVGTGGHLRAVSVQSDTPILAVESSLIPPPFRMSLDSISSECFCSSPNDHQWAGTQIFSPQAPFWTRGQLHHPDPPTFSTSTLSATHLLPSSLPPHNLHRVSELTTLSSPGIPWLALPFGCLMRHTSSRRPVQYKGKGGSQASSYLPQPILLQLTDA